MEYIQIQMIRDHLEDLPTFSWPDGMHTRFFRDGDQRIWLKVQRASEPFIKIEEKHFENSFGDDLPAMPRRSLFVCSPEGEEIGTITSWYRRRWRGRGWGQIHWVAIVPEYRGQGLAKPMLAEALELMRTRGHRRAMLVTHTVRIPAIQLYLNFGFRPDMQTENGRSRWEEVAQKISHPLLDAALKS